MHGTATLLLIAAGAVGLQLFLTMEVHLHAFISLVLVSLLTTVVAGIPLAEVPDALLAGFGGPGLRRAPGRVRRVMPGRFLAVTGGAQCWPTR